ncbi:MAG: V-type ATP synthase subunit F [candidate division WOR-3 bacterium]
MKRVAVIGKYETVFPFKSVGMDCIVCATGSEVREKIKEAISADYGLIFVEEDYYEDIKDIVESLREVATPAITFIPGAGGSTGMAREKLRSAILKAIGIDVF